MFLCHKISMMITRSRRAHAAGTGAGADTAAVARGRFQCLSCDVKGVSDLAFIVFLVYMPVNDRYWCWC